MRSIRSSGFPSLVVALLTAGCGAEAHDPKVPWSDQRTQILTPDGQVKELAPASGTECLEHEGECLKPQEKCGLEAVDIVLDSDGKVLDYLCYPGESTLAVEELEANDGDLAQHENNTVIVLDEHDDGADIDGDVSVDANNVVIYGDSAETAQIAGSLTLDGNNALVRGVRIQGDVTIVKNNATLAFCVIEGNLTITGNDTRLLGCDVLGQLNVTGNNTKIYGNRIVGPLASTGKNTDCTDNFSAADGNGDRIIAASEVGAALSCK
jgi:hypothetical protein